VLGLTRHVLNFCCRAVELKIAQAVRKRVDMASLTCRELGKVLNTRLASDLAVKNSYAEMLILVTEESASLFPALSAMKDQFGAIARAYDESAHTLEQEIVTRSATMKDSFTAQTQQAAKEVGSHLAELQAARLLCKQSYAKQEKAMAVVFNPHGTVENKNEAATAQLAINCDLDPWLSTVAHEAAIKGVETLAAKQQDAFQRGVNDVIDADDRRIEATKSVLLSFLQSEKKKLQAHLDAVETLFDCVQDINPSADAHSFLSHYNISEADLSRNQSKAVKTEGNAGDQPPDMGVWVPDDSVKVCLQVPPQPCCPHVSVLCRHVIGAVRHVFLHVQAQASLQVLVAASPSRNLSRSTLAQILWPRFLRGLHPTQRHASRTFRLQRTAARVPGA
jgi:hypothetical protein